MSNVSVADLTELKTLVITGEFLRWVKSEKDWFQSDPTSSATADNFNVIAPNTGIGRWLRQRSANTNNTGLIWSNQTANFTAVANNGYAVSPASGNAIALFPASPSIGQVIVLSYTGTTDIARKLVTNRNGQLINGGTSDVQLYRRDQRVTFTYVSAGYGWQTDSNQAIDYFQAAVTFAAPASTNVAQNGIINYLGTNLGTGAFVNPANPSASPSRPRRVKIVTGASWVNYGNATDRAVNGNSQIASPDGSGGFGWLIAFYRGDTLDPIKVKLSSLFVEWLGSATTTLTGNAVPDTFGIHGTNSLGNNLSLAEVEALTTSNWLSASEIRHILSPNWTQLANFPNNKSGGSQGVYKTAASTTAKLYSVNSNEFYSYFLLAAHQPVATTTTYSMNINELEFYGDVIAT